MSEFINHWAELISAVSIIIAAACWAYISHYTFQNRVKDVYSFWGSESWKRKYKRSKHIGNSPADKVYNLIAAPDTWYYKTFKVKYKEKFLFSDNLLVFVTDGYHLLQFVMIKFLALAPAVHSERPLIAFGVYWLLWVFTFNSIYISKKQPN